MAYLARLIYAGAVALLVCVCALLPLKSHASGGVGATNAWSQVSSFIRCFGAGRVFSSGGTFVGSVDDAVAAINTAFNPICVRASGGGTFGSSSYNAGTGRINFEIDIGGGSWVGVYTQQSAAQCPANSTASGAACVCNSGYSPGYLSLACVADSSNCGAHAGDLYGFSGEVTVPVNGVGVQGSVCTGGCRYDYRPGPGIWGRDGGGQWYFTGQAPNFVNSGTACAAGTGNGTASSPPDKWPNPVPPGMCPGTINGQTVMVPCQVTSSGSGGTSGNSSGTQTGTSNTGTTCIGGSCTTTTNNTGTGSNGTGGGTSGSGGNGNPCSGPTCSVTSSREAYCAQNPGDKANCGDKDPSFSGTCAATSCSGDAIQCQIAKEQAKRNCEFFAPTGSAVDAGVAAGAAGARAADHPALSPDVVSMSSVLDQTDLISATCPADITLTLVGRTFPLELSKVCAPAAILGNVMVGVCMLAGVFIIFKQ